MVSSTGFGPGPDTRRAYPRRQVTLPASWQDASGKLYRGTVLDISRFGLFLEPEYTLGGELAPAHPISVVVTLPGDSRRTSLARFAGPAGGVTTPKALAWSSMLR